MAPPAGVEGSAATVRVAAVGVASFAAGAAAVIFVVLATTCLPILHLCEQRIPRLAMVLCRKAPGLMRELVPASKQQSSVDHLLSGDASRGG